MLFTSLKVVRRHLGLGLGPAEYWHHCVKKLNLAPIEVGGKIPIVFNGFLGQVTFPVDELLFHAFPSICFCEIEAFTSLVPPDFSSKMSFFSNVRVG